DPYNAAVVNLVNQLHGWKKDRAAAAAQALPNLQQLEKAVEQEPANFQKVFNLASAYMQIGQNERGYQVLDGVLTNPRADAAALKGIMEAYANINRPKLQASVDTLQARARSNPTNF